MATKTYYVNTRYANGKGYTWFVGTLEECQAYYCGRLFLGSRAADLSIDDYPVDDKWMDYADLGHRLLEILETADSEVDDADGESAPEGESVLSPAPAHADEKTYYVNFQSLTRKFTVFAGSESACYAYCLQRIECGASPALYEVDDYPAEGLPSFPAPDNTPLRRGLMPDVPKAVPIFRPDPCISCRHEPDSDSLWCSVCPHDPENQMHSPRESSPPPDVQTVLTLPMAARTPWDFAGDDSF